MVPIQTIRSRKTHDSCADSHQSPPMQRRRIFCHRNSAQIGCSESAVAGRRICRKHPKKTTPTTCSHAVDKWGTAGCCMQMSLLKLRRKVYHRCWLRLLSDGSAFADLLHNLRCKCPSSRMHQPCSSSEAPAHNRRSPLLQRSDYTQCEQPERQRMPFRFHDGALRSVSRAPSRRSRSESKVPTPTNRRIYSRYPQCRALRRCSSPFGVLFQSLAIHKRSLAHRSAGGA